MSKPSTLKEVVLIATQMFQDKAVSSVVVESTFGNIEILRGDLWLDADYDNDDE